MRLAPVAALLLVASTGAAVAVAAPADPVEREHVLVTFEGSAIPLLAAGEAAYGGHVDRVLGRIGAVRIATHDAGLTRRLAEQDPRVAGIEMDRPDAVRPLYVPTDPYHAAPHSWPQERVRAPVAWDATRGSPGVLVAVLDSGLEAGHPEFASQARVRPGIDVVQGDSIAQDDCGHGTGVTGLLAGTMDNGAGIAGMAQVGVLPVRVLARQPDGSCAGYASDLAEGIVAAVDAGADVLTASLAVGSASKAVAAALREASDAGVTVVAAAGNSGPCADCVSHPWRDEPQVIVVGATDNADAPASFSSQGPQVDLAAPGQQILAPTLGGAYRTVAGTSFAAPLVAGTAALLLSLDPELTPAAVQARLRDTAHDVGPAGPDDATGAGRLDAGRAVNPGYVEVPLATPFDARFTQVRGNAWWVQASVHADRPIAGVDARVDGGAWRPLKLQSWGGWAASFSIPDGSVVQLQARSGSASQGSGCHVWPSAAPVACDAAPPAPTPTATTTTFQHKGGNGWWVEVSVGGRPSDVQARAGDGSWHTLKLESWGHWAGSFRIEPGNTVRFRALTGVGWTESCAFTHPGGAAQCGAAPTPSPDPGPSTFAATFSNVRGNAWWVETDVVTRGATLAGVDARVESGAWVPLAKQSYGSWAKSIAAPAGSTVEFRARSGDGQVATSGPHAWG